MQEAQMPREALKDPVCALIMKIFRGILQTIARTRSLRSEKRFVDNTETAADVDEHHCATHNSLERSITLLDPAQGCARGVASSAYSTRMSDNDD